MGGGNRKRFNKSRSRRMSQSSSVRALFVEGGILENWSSPSFNSHSSSGGKGKSDSSRSRNGKGKHGSSSASGSAHGSTSRVDHVKNMGNAVGYVYPSFDYQDGLYPNIDEDKRKDIVSHPSILLDTKETPIVAYEDEGPSKNMQVTEYSYDYTAGFALEEGSHRGLGFNDETKETPASFQLSSKIEKIEGCIEPSTTNEGPVKNIPGSDFECDYTTGFTLDEGSHRGLGFHDEGKDAPSFFAGSSKIEEKSGSFELSSSNEEDMIAENGIHNDTSTKREDDLLGTTSSPDENPGFLSIGGLKIYTQDISDDEGNEEELLDEESSDYSETGDSTNSSESNGVSDSDSDIDDEIAADYFQGIGGSDDFVNIDQLVGMVPAVLDDDSDSSDSFDETLEKFGGIALQEASKDYGMLKPQSERKIRREDHKVTPGKYNAISAMDDLMLVKDPRTVSGRKRHTKRIPQSWPFESRKSQKGRKIPGEKKKHRKDMIAVKRRERMIRRGVDLRHINSKLQQMVLDGGGILSFQPMHTRDCSQVQRLAAIYCLRSVSEGSGKKKFVTVTQTRHTCMPSATDRVRLEKLIGANDEDDDFTVCDMKPFKVDRKTKKTTKNTESSVKNSQTDPSKKKRSMRTSYAAQPVSFVSSGVMCSDVVEVEAIDSSEANETCWDNKAASSSLQYGSFELHTTGFGSKMMAKMGYVEGQGLGKDGQGMAEPIEVLQRPKSLGLGANIPDGIPEASGRLAKRESRSMAPRCSFGTDGKNGKSERKESQQFAAFEKYTTGFGSKMMAKMGFVEGMGLGKDSQGMVTPLVAVRRPKSQGLGAKH